MINYIDLIIAFLISLLLSFALTFPVRKLAVRWGIVDLPNYRKIHTKITPRFSGIAIFISSMAGLLYLQPKNGHMAAIILGAIVIIIVGTLDDRYNVRPIIKLTGQFMAASFLISSGLIIEKVTLPFIGMIDLGFVSVLVTVLWVVGITNAIKLIDGLDGLATGVSTIALISILIMAIIDSQLIVIYFCVVLIGSNLGFLYHNYYPAKIYMGDTGSNYLGYMIAVISMLGLFKNVAILSFLIPIIILAVPIIDTLFAIARRLKNNESIMMADNKHVHYQLLKFGFSHRVSVLIMYALSAVFGALAILFSKASFALSFFIGLIVFFLVHILAELTGLVLDGKRPVVDLILRMFKRRKRDKEKN